MSDMFDEALCALKKLVAIDSVQAAPCNASPFGEGVAKCLQFVADDAKSRGFKVGLGDGYYVWAETGEGDLFGVLGHLDTVPLGGGWHADPLGEIKDGVFYGRGVLDDKGPMTLAFYAALSLLKEGKKPKRRIRFIWGGNEESGWKCIERYLQREELPKEGISPDADFPVINCEKGVAHVRLTFAKPKEVVSMKGGERVNVVMPECRAKVRGEIGCDLAESVSDGATALVAHGAAAHGSTPLEGVNAGWKMLKTLAGFSPECGRLAALLCDHDGSGLGIACRDEKSGELLEPFETMYVEVPDEHVPGVLKLLNTRKAHIEDMESREGTGRTFFQTYIPTRGIIGFEFELVNLTSGHGIFSHLFRKYAPYAGEILARQTGRLVSMQTGVTTKYALLALEDRGKLFVAPQEDVYVGQIVGENPRPEDIPVNPCKEKHLDNMRSAGKDPTMQLSPAIEFSLERAIEYIDGDELVEATPHFIRLRKRILDPIERKRSEKTGAAI